jgi:hypothetical protein
MNLNKLHDKLIAVAKRNPPSDHVPYAFEKRIMSRLAAAPPLNHWALWSGPLWRGAVSCIAITVLCGVWSIASNKRADSQESFNQTFESAVFAPPGQNAEDAW